MTSVLVGGFFSCLGLVTLFVFKDMRSYIIRVLIPLPFLLLLTLLTSSAFAAPGDSPEFSEPTTDLSVDSSGDSGSETLDESLSPSATSPSTQWLESHPKSAPTKYDQKPLDIYSTPTQQSASPALARAPKPRGNRHIPAMQLLRPNWGVEINGTISAFGGNALVPSQGTNQTTAIDILVEWQPAFVQSIGVLGIGPSLNYYPIFAGSVTPSLASNFSVGAQIRYQAFFFRQQPVVPIAAYNLEYFKYSFNTEGSGAFLIQGPTFGLWVLLNFIEPSSSFEMYESTGILRSYLTLEWKSMSGTDGIAKVSGGSYYAGLRFEF